MGGVPKTVALWLSFALFPLDRFQIVFILRYKPAKIPFINQSITTYLIYVVEASTHLLTGDSLSASSSPLNSSASNCVHGARGGAGGGGCRRRYDLGRNLIPEEPVLLAVNGWLESVRIIGWIILIGHWVVLVRILGLCLSGSQNAQQGQ